MKLEGSCTSAPRMTGVERAIAISEMRCSRDAPVVTASSRSPQFLRQCRAHHFVDRAPGPEQPQVDFVRGERRFDARRERRRRELTRGGRTVAEVNHLPGAVGRESSRGIEQSAGDIGRTRRSSRREPSAELGEPLVGRLGEPRWGR